MVKGVLYATAGTRRSVIALDAATGELLWVHGEHEGARAAAAARQLSGRGLSYWTDGKGDDRILYVTPGYRLVCLNAKTGALSEVVRRKRAGRYEAVRGIRNRAADRSGDRRDRPAFHSRGDEERCRAGGLVFP